MPLTTVHPRRRGEHTLDVTGDDATIGSSPQARGTLILPAFTSTSTRFIPAGAGNTLQQNSQRSSRPVHPRRRGEHSPFLPLPVRNAGSSPQARGTPRTLEPCRSFWRFIPAGAGNTSHIVTLEGATTVHPRRRGEHNGSKSRTTRIAGSSPQARGTLVHLRTYRLYSAVHPRRRGEHGLLYVLRAI